VVAFPSRNKLTSFHPSLTFSPEGKTLMCWACGAGVFGLPTAKRSPPLAGDQLAPGDQLAAPIY
jgi:hypothetical protein